MLEPQKPQERINRGYEIYALIDPRDNLVRYVGLSISANIRFISHLNGNGGNEQEKRWIVELQREGLTPILQILETIEAGSNSYALACEEELYWIREMAHQGHPLLNVIGITHPYVPAVPPYRTTESKRMYIEEVVTSTEIDTSQIVGVDKADTEPVPISQNEGERMLTVEQVAEEMNVDKKTVRKWINQGDLRAVNIGRIRPEYRISRRNLDLFKQERETGRQGL